MGEVNLLPISIFVTQGYVQHASSEWLGEHCIRYYSYFIPENHVLPNAIAFAYEKSTALGSKTAAGIFRKRPGPVRDGL